jgi:SAM-dependent methyltransferase
MTPTLMDHGFQGRSDAVQTSRARDWAEIQERMFVPLYDSVYQRLEVGRDTRLLGLGCGSGLALLRAAALGAEVTGADTDTDLLRLARERLLPEPERGGRRWPARLVAAAVPESEPAPYTLITAFSSPPTAAELRRAAALARPGSPVVLAGWSDPGQCAATIAERVGSRPAVPAGGPAQESRLTELATAAGLSHRETGEVSCPFGYPGLACALRGLLATGSFDGAVVAAGAEHVAKELTDALHPYVEPEGTVWLPNPLTYVIAETPH